jgi:ATP-dependent helicase HrpA
MLAGLLGNIGAKADDDEWYLGARGIRFWRHPGVHLSKKPGRWIVAAELVETTRLYARGIAAIDVQWLPQVGAHLLKKQLLEPHWERKAGEVIALERATLYGLEIYNDRKVVYASLDPAGARAIFIREALVEGDWDSRLPFLAHNRKLVRQVEELEHKSRRQDVLVDDELIFAFYDRQLPADVTGAAALERWLREADPKVLMLTRDELMRHEAAGVTSAAFPPTVRLGGIDCAATYLHEPGDSRDGVTVTVPIYALNQVSEERTEWLVPGMLAAKVQALLKSLPQKPRARLVPLPAAAAELSQALAFGDGGLIDALLAAVRERTQLPSVQRNDFKHDTLPEHLRMNIRVVDEHGRQLAMGRHLAALKAEHGAQARSAFQVLAGLKPQVKKATPAVTPAAAASTTLPAAARYTDWAFGELPELMEVKKGGQSLVGFPALVDRDTFVEIEVFDEPDVAAARHRAGLRRLVALQLREPLKFLDRNIPDLPRMAGLYMTLGTADELRAQIVELALERAFLAEPWPSDATGFERRLSEGRPRLNLIAQEVARLAHTILVEHAAAQRKLKDSKPAKEVADDIAAQLARLVPKRFLADTPWAQLQHLPRYLKAVVARLDKQRSDPARDTARLAELRPLEQRYWRRVAERRGAMDARLADYRWLLEELRVSLFAQELRTPQPVSAKRLDRAWEQLSG